MIDRLIDRIKELKAPVVVGLDPTVDMLDKKPKNIPEAFFEFNCRIIDQVYDLVPAVKPQIAMYERYGVEGLKAYVQTAEYAQSRGLIVIGDIKRNDIGSTAEGYAAHIDGNLWHEDAVTLNPYLGVDSIMPFLKICEEQDKGIIILVKTSNPSSVDLQDQKLENGKLVYEHVGDLVSEWGFDKKLIGKHGYSKVCAVVGATFPEQGRALRKRMPHTFFLVPGYGAQGGSGKDLKGFFDKNGLGCIVNSSRGITAAWKKGITARQATQEMIADLQEAIK